MTTADGKQRGVAIVTGASDGIGAELARVFAARGHDLALVARRADRLEALADEIVAQGAERRPLVIALDLCAAGAIEALAKALDEAGARAEILVNNAGFGLVGSVEKLDPAEQLAIIDLNVRALTALTLRFLPSIVACQGAILNVASIAAFMPGPSFAIYYATKAYVLSFSEALTQELSAGGVKVSCLCPGPVETGFQARSGFELKGKLGAARLALVSPAEVARQGYEGLMAGRRVVVPGLMNQIIVLVARFVPRGWLMTLTAAALDKR
ncbi:SDR family NAD(P)-dependent oxidoreductase [Methylocystis bryophila]|uniref:Short-chain dehydrogenase n=1 Tax=Methylocystis bryophila TaxID=655015 RepID=A0A1W6MTG7_9HYPH|nr:SDR family oxidoreductase [Methylocystis bryophila]ARN80894.1 short-chain dehydrogenase [Methylocystis bryophila]BDV36784.1 short-chain dehydrogenase [Methylocystis bryophila]